MRREPVDPAREVVRGFVLVGRGRQRGTAIRECVVETLVLVASEHPAAVERVVLAEVEVREDVVELVIDDALERQDGVLHTELLDRRHLEVEAVVDTLRARGLGEQDLHRPAILAIHALRTSLVVWDAIPQYVTASDEPLSSLFAGQQGTSCAPRRDMPKLPGSVAVVTGASSGLGRAIAVELARRGASVVLAARRTDALEETAEQCRKAGGNALVVETDVSLSSDVDVLARTAVDEYGQVDIWVNNAGVTLFSRLEDGPFDDHKRVIETNLFGAMYGARAVIPIFRRQKRGVMINVGSVLSEVGHAFVPSYVISKFGIHGLSEALRVELADEPDIHVCTVFPFSLDTPHFDVAANHMQRAPRALPPMQSPEHVARAVAAMCERPRRVRFVPRSSALGLMFHALAPRASERLLLAALRKFHMSDERQPFTQGNLYEPPSEPAHTHGHRPPQIGALRFFAWAALRLVRIELGFAARRIGRWLAPRPRQVIAASSAAASASDAAERDLARFVTAGPAATT